jgi:hypothetical protein
MVLDPARELDVPPEQRACNDVLNGSANPS